MMEDKLEVKNAIEEPCFSYESMEIASTTQSNT